MLNTEIIRKLRKSLRLFERELHNYNITNCCVGVTFKQCHILLSIDDADKTNVSKLSKTMNLDKSTISRTIEGLVSINLVDRVIPQDNRRSTVITLTKEGQKLCDSINNSNDNYFANILCSFTDKEIIQLSGLLERTAYNMVNYKECCEKEPKNVLSSSVLKNARSCGD
ncbi:MAG: MarR family transcriptional regulator [Bacteroidetes bacterium]|nr:MarR family transcriptional regulator [Bacteroidota bacterium]